MNKLVEGSGPLDAKLWIIGEAPGEQEAAEGKPFVGVSGKLLRQKLTLCDIDPSEVRMENLIGERPPKNKFTWFQETEERANQLSDSIRALKARIRECKPSLVLCVGAQPLKFIMDKHGIGAWRGHVLWSHELDCKVMATYHPSACIRQRYVGKSQHPGQYDALMQADIQKAAREIVTRELTFVEYQTMVEPSFSEAVRELEKLRDEAEIISYDIETLGGCLMDCIGFCSKPDFAFCIPFYVPTGTELVRYWKSDNEFLEIFRLVKEVLESDIPKVAQNSQYDDVILKAYYDIDVKNLVWDTMVAAHDLYSELPKDLGTLISLYANIPYQKFLGKSQNKRDHWEYNATDALANLHVMGGEIKEAEELDVLKHYITIVHPVIRVLREMQLTGVKVNEEFREAAIYRETYLQQEILETINEVLPIRFNTAKNFPFKFNPNSPIDKKNLFIKCFGCKQHVTNGKPSLDKHALAKYMKDPRDYVRLFAQIVRMHRLSTTSAGRLKTPLRNGRMHTSYTIGGVSVDEDEIGTDTGRLASRASILGSGTNLQNLQEGPQRQMLIPDTGEEFLYLDQWAAEAYLTALDANEPELLGMLNKGIKIHQWMLDLTRERFPKDCELAGYNYKKAKQTVHALDYGVEPRKMSQESGLPEEICSWQYNRFHNKFPGIKMRMVRIQNQLENFRVLRSRLGRQKVVISILQRDTLNQCYAWPSQSVIGELTLIGMTKIFYAGKVDKTWMFPALNTHDGLACRIKKGNREAGKKIAVDAFRVPITAFENTITIPIEIGWSENFNDIKDKEVIKYA